MRVQKISMWGKAGALLMCLLFAVSIQAQPKREFRSAWLTTVWAIDWPTTYNDKSKAGQQAQQNELMAIVDSLAAANMNAVYFQVRGFSDAMYNSQYEPWSQYLTGTRGGQPSYDPLALLIEYAHYKGIEVHAWLNPYRYSTSEATHGTLPTDYPTTHPEWLVNCGGITILNPCLPEVKQRIKEVVGDIVNHYDVDGIIFDDYFYQSGYQNTYDDAYYTASGTTLSRANWRREQVNEMVRMVHDTIQAVKPYVSFGIGPAGVAGKSNTSAPVYGVEGCPVGSDWQYNGIYSDPLAWYDQHTIDYMAPQLYWTIGSANDYLQLTEWWSKMACHFGRHMYASQDLSGLVSDATTPSSGKFHASEIGNQMQADRDYDLLGAPGCSWYSLKTGLKTKGFIRYIRNNVNQHPAIWPQKTWYPVSSCLYVSNISVSGMTVSWTAPAANLRYAVYDIPTSAIGQANACSAEHLLGVTYTSDFTLATAPQGTIAVSVVDRYGVEYPARTLGSSAWGTAPVAQLTFPADQASVLLPCNFTWQPTAGVDSYVFELSRHADFSTVDYQRETSATEFFTGNIEWLSQDSTYYWRIRTRMLNGSDSYSAVRSFVGGYFRIQSPAYDDRDLSRLPTFVCDSVPAAQVNYKLEIASASTFKASEIVYTGQSARHIIQVADTLMPSTFYFARVTATYGDISAVSQTVRFRTEAIEVVVPTLISPADGDTIYGSSVVVVWQAQQSGGFRTELATATSFASRVTKVANISAGTYTHTYENVAPGTYYLRVKAIADGVWTDPCDYVTIYVLEPTGFENLTSAGLGDVQKTIEDGQVIIIRNGKKYSVIGTIINNK